MRAGQSETDYRTWGGVAAGLNALVGLGTAAVAVVLVGLDAMTDRSRFLALAIENPAPLLVQDGLKIISAAIMVALLLAFLRMLRPVHPRAAAVAAIFRAVAVVLLLANAGLSLYATSRAASFATGEAGAALGLQLNLVIGILAFAALVADGVWFVLVHWAAGRADLLPRRLCYLGLAVGLTSVLIVTAFLGLLASIAWSVWLSVFWLARRPLPAARAAAP